MNYSEEEKKSHKKFSRKLYNQKPEQKRKRRDYQREYRKNYPDRVKATAKKCYESNRTQRLAKAREFQKLPCKDPVLGDTVTYNCLTLRIRLHPDLYGNVKAKDFMIHIPKIKGLNLLSEEQKEVLEVNSKNN